MINSTKRTKYSDLKEPGTRNKEPGTKNQESKVVNIKKPGTEYNKFD